ncbi:GNAT family N-acetyltransferase [Flavobacterium antarcticum]|uniref:GNAT family N-acetyltransferase n=1 Tax=Flavobacterium antarcticum TaxID=271155 RepID=UPI0003B5230C|nr:GNAT family acetyltransferase [Flavobacterium antarcticum]
MITTRIATVADITQILSLQELYLFRNLNEQERLEGFVTTPFTTEQIEEAIEQRGLFIAQNEDLKVVAYAFAASWTYFAQWEIFNYMVSRFPSLSFQGDEITTENSFQYGPVCIDKKYRGTGLLPLIFEEMRLELLKKFPISITFINKINPISEKAHKKLGWEIVDEFEFNSNSYIGLALDMNKSVLK